MLQSIREKTSGWIATIILGLIILTMALWGIESYLSPTVENYAVRIEGPAKFWKFGAQKRDISPDEFRKRFDQVRTQRRQSEGAAFDAAAFERVDNKRAARQGRNPQTGDTIKIKASKNPAFKAGKALKDAVN